MAMPHVPHPPRGPSLHLGTSPITLAIAPMPQGDPHPSRAVSTKTPRAMARCLPTCSSPLTHGTSCVCVCVCAPMCAPVAGCAPLCARCWVRTHACKGGCAAGSVSRCVCRQIRVGAGISCAGMDVAVPMGEGGWREGWTEGWTDRWLAGQVGGWVDGWNRARNGMEDEQGSTAEQPCTVPEHSPALAPLQHPTENCSPLLPAPAHIPNPTASSHPHPTAPAQQPEQQPPQAVPSPANPKWPPTHTTIMVMSSVVLSPTGAGAAGVFPPIPKAALTHAEARAVAEVSAQPPPGVFLAPLLPVHGDALGWGPCAGMGTGTVMGTGTAWPSTRQAEEKAARQQGKEMCRDLPGVQRTCLTPLPRNPGLDSAPMAGSWEEWDGMSTCPPGRLTAAQGTQSALGRL